MSLFLTDEELVTLTGRKRKASQVAALRAMAVPFRINAVGWPVVARATFEPSATPAAAAAPEKTWEPGLAGQRASRSTPRLSMMLSTKKRRTP